MSWVHLTPKSANRKIGPIPVSTTSKRSCPPTCPLRGAGCYAQNGPLAIHWAQVKSGKRGSNWARFCGRVRRFERGQVWRHNQAGDLPPQRNRRRMHRTRCLMLARAAAHTRGWTYTHWRPTDRHNRETVRQMNAIGGLVVNLSADNTAQADAYAALGCGPVVCLMPNDAPAMGNRTPGGLPIVICPAQTHDDITCDQCQLCAVRDRKSIVGFRAHGPYERILSEGLE